MTEEQYNVLFDAFTARQEEPETEGGAPRTLSKRYKETLRDLGWFLLSINEPAADWAKGILEQRRLLKGKK